MAFDHLLNHVPVKKKYIHVMRTDIDIAQSADEYEQTLHAYFPDVHHTFDLVLLGLGEDAHVLSLFPGQQPVHEKKKWVLPAYMETLKEERITLTAPAVNAAARTAFLVSGSDKGAALFHVLSGDHDPSLYPAQIIQPFNSQLYWWVDEAASRDLG